MQSVAISLPSEAISMPSTRTVPLGATAGADRNQCQSACSHPLGGWSDRNQCQSACSHPLGGWPDRKRRWRVRQRDCQMVLKARGTWGDLTKHAVGGTEGLVAACCAQPLHTRLREL